MRDLGARVQLGHLPGVKCDKPVPSYGDTFTVIDDTGIHDIHLDFCGCHARQAHYVQILRYGWFPASVKQPRSAATCHVLKLFDLLSCEAKCSAWEFYSSLVRMSDNTGVKKVKVCPTLLFRVICPYPIVQGPILCFFANAAGICASENTQARWAGTFAIRGSRHSTRRVCGLVPRMPTARDEHGFQLVGDNESGQKVRDRYIA